MTKAVSEHLKGLLQPPIHLEDAFVNENPTQSISYNHSHANSVALAHPEWPGSDRIRHADVVEIEIVVFVTWAALHVLRLDASASDIMILVANKKSFTE